MLVPLLFNSLNVYSPAKGNMKINILVYDMILPSLRSNDSVTFLRSSWLCYINIVASTISKQKSTYLASINPTFKWTELVLVRVRIRWNTLIR